MSLIDPSSRWWNRYDVRRSLAWLLWGLGMVACAIAGWVSAGDFGEGRYAEFLGISFTAGLILTLGGTFLRGFGRRNDEDLDARFAIMPVAAMFAAQGVGGIARSWVDGVPIAVISAVFALVGFLGLLIIQVVAVRMRRKRMLMERVERTGTVTTGVVTRASTYQQDYSTVTRVTVEFVDSAGDRRWAGQTLPGNIPMRAKVQVRYSQADLGRKGAVVLSR